MVCNGLLRVVCVVCALRGSESLKIGLCLSCFAWLARPNKMVGQNRLFIGFAPFILGENHNKIGRHPRAVGQSLPSPHAIQSKASALFVCPAFPASNRISAFNHIREMHSLQRI